MSIKIINLQVAGLRNVIYTFTLMKYVILSYIEIVII